MRCCLRLKYECLLHLVRLALFHNVSTSALTITISYDEYKLHVIWFPSDLRLGSKYIVAIHIYVNILY